MDIEVIWDYIVKKLGSVQIKVLYKLYVRQKFEEKNSTFAIRDVRVYRLGLLTVIISG